MIQRHRLTPVFWDLLSDALMWPGLIEVLTIGMKDTVQLLLMKDEQVIETLSTHTAWSAPTTSKERAITIRGNCTSAASPPADISRISSGQSIVLPGLCLQT
jgi:hypothetical protein